MHSVFISFKSLLLLSCLLQKRSLSDLDCLEQPSRGIARKEDERSIQVIQVKEVFIVRGQSRNGLVRKSILEKIQESGNRGLSVYELSWVTGADIFFILTASHDLVGIVDAEFDQAGECTGFVIVEIRPAEDVKKSQDPGM